MKIKTINSKLLGECDIHFDIKTDKFSVSYKKSDRNGQITSSDHSDMDSVLAEIQVNELNSAAGLLTDRFIFIYFKSHLNNKKGDIFGQSPMELVGKGSGFTLDWCIADQYKFTEKKFDGYMQPKTNEEYFKKKQVKYKNIDTYYYKIVEVAKHSNIKLREDFVRFEHPHATLSLSEYSHKVKYTEEIHNFLINLEKSMDDMILKVNTFFDCDGEKLIENIQRGNHTLLG